MVTTSASSSSAVAAAKGVLYSILLRLLSFSLSQLTIRLIDDPRTLGYSTVQLELLCSSTVLFLSREGFRLSLVRISTVVDNRDGQREGNASNSGVSCSSDDQDEKILKLNNVALLTIPFGLLLVILSLCIHIYQCNNNNHLSGRSRDNYDYKIAGFYYSLATIIEILGEPCMIHCLQTFKVEIRAKAEGMASIAKAFATLLLLSSIHVNQESSEKDFQLLGPIATFGIAQIVYAITLTTTLFLKTKDTMPKLKWPYSFHKQALNLSITFTFQSIFKHLLTEGDRIILSTLVSSYNSGIYAMVSSYGSIVSRMIFLPLEENGRLLFSNYHSKISSLTIQQDGNTTTEGNDKTKQEISNLIDQFEKTYIILVKLALYVGLLFLSFGTNYTKTLLQILAGSKWANNEASETLSVYCSYILWLALNGMTEAFVYGVVDDRAGVGLLTIVHGLVGIVFYILTPFLVIWQDRGTIGLIVANEICMVLRSIYSLDYAASYFMNKKDPGGQNSYSGKDDKKAGLANMVFFTSLTNKFYSICRLTMKVLPTKPVLLSFMCSFKLTQISRQHFLEAKEITSISTETLVHILIGVSLLIVTFINIWKFDRDFLQGLKLFVRSPPPKLTDTTKEKED